MKNEFLLRENICTEFTTNVEALTKDMEDLLYRKVNIQTTLPILLHDLSHSNQIANRK